MNADEDRWTRGSFREFDMENEGRTFEEMTDGSVVDVRREDLHSAGFRSNEIDEPFFVRRRAQRWRDDRLVFDRFRLFVKMREKLSDNTILLGQIDDLLKENHFVAEKNLRDVRVDLRIRRGFRQRISTKIERSDFHSRRFQ